MTSFALLTRTAMALSAFVGIGVVASAEGCGPGDTRYYCDSSGCYNCDGYGCHPVAPPTNTKCTGDKACATNQICTDTGCVAVCKADTDCPQGDVCKANQCVAPNGNPGNLVKCTSDKDCAAGEACVGSGATAYCTAQSNACQYSSQCGQGKVCANGECLADCSQNASICSAGTTCVKGVCEPNANQCTSDAQCSGSTPKCSEGSCVAACDPNAATSSCPTGEYCNDGACVTDNRPQPNCGNGGATCAANQTCLDGFCRYTCNTPNGELSQDCEHIDTRIGYCAKDSTCRDVQEAQAQCLESSDCTGGKICISNTCQ